MKTKTTRTEMYNFWGKERVIELGYCAIQSITPYLRETHYTCGVYGWNANIYELDNFAICTGYRPFGTYDRRLSDYCERWNNIFKNTPYEKRKAKVKRFENGLFKLLQKVTDK